MKGRRSGFFDLHSSGVPLERQRETVKVVFNQTEIRTHWLTAASVCRAFSSEDVVWNGRWQLTVASVWRMRALLVHCEAAGIARALRGSVLSERAASSCAAPQSCRRVYWHLIGSMSKLFRCRERDWLLTDPPDDGRTTSVRNTVSLIFLVPLI
jgi:hypothetical protein